MSKVDFFLSLKNLVPDIFGKSKKNFFFRFFYMIFGAPKKMDKTFFGNRKTVYLRGIEGGLRRVSKLSNSTHGALTSSKQKLRFLVENSGDFFEFWIFLIFWKPHPSLE